MNTAETAMTNSSKQPARVTKTNGRLENTSFVALGRSLRLEYPLLSYEINYQKVLLFQDSSKEI